MNATEAIAKGKELLKMFRPLVEGLRVETVTENAENKHWKVTLSFYDDDTGVASAILSQRNRVYKTIEIDSKGQLAAIDNASK